ncbi:MAG: hypothetical protein [Bacteriophage sp.]|nr:MAG: hypothetical protein [Bacteriophage sp.]
MGKKVKKAFKSVTKTLSKVPGSGFSDSGGDAVKAQEVAPPPPTVTAQPAVIAEEEKTTEDVDVDTEAAKKAAKRGGKQGLSVARSSGNGLNV